MQGPPDGAAEAGSAMHSTFVTLAFLAAAAPAFAQHTIGENPVLAGSTTCGAFVRMDLPAQLQALSAVEPVGDALGTANPALAAQWASEVSNVCTGDPNRRLDAAARQALGPE
jgi:hypothetical protein